MKRIIITAGTALALAGCGSAPATTATTGTVTRPAATAAQTAAIATSLARACAVARAVQAQAYTLHGLPPVPMLIAIHGASPAWQAELKAGEQPAGNGVPQGENAANMANVGLAKAVLALALGDLAYQDGEMGQAVRDYTGFVRGLNRMTGRRCG